MTETEPNLYDFATKELSQDATLAYLLSWAKPEYRSRHPKLNQLGESLLRTLVRMSARACGVADPLESAPVEKVELAVQENHIDVCAEINEDVFLLIEDKVDTQEHSGQIARYTREVRKRMRKRRNPPVVLPIYVKTGNECLILDKAPICGVFLRKDMLDVLDAVGETGNTIVENFRRHLRAIQAETDSYLHEPCGDWSWRAVQGYYAALTDWLDALPDRRNGENDPGWHYVPNPSGGFTGFWWHWCECKALRCNIYLQIEDACCLKIRAGDVRNEAGKSVRIDSDRLWQVFEAVQAAGEDSRFASLRPRKAGVFRGGWGGHVAELQFDGGEKTYIAASDADLIDMPATQDRLRLAMDFVTAVRDKAEEASA